MMKVRTEFPNVWGEYEIPQQFLYTGTTVPCDTGNVSSRLHTCIYMYQYTDIEIFIILYIMADY